MSEKKFPPSSGRGEDNVFWMGEKVPGFLLLNKEWVRCLPGAVYRSGKEVQAMACVACSSSASAEWVTIRGGL